MKKIVLALAIAVPALAFAADPPSSDAPKKTEMKPDLDPSTPPKSTDDIDAKTASPTETRAPNMKAASAASESDIECLAKLHHDNEMETRMGQLAQKNGQAKQVKEFGKLLVKDHGLADKQITALAKKKNIDLNLPEPKDASEKAERGAKMDKMEKLESLTGDEFDREFAKMMVEDHQKAVDLVTTTVQQTQDAKIQAVLNKLLPVLKEHLRIAQQINKRVESV